MPQALEDEHLSNFEKAAKKRAVMPVILGLAIVLLTGFAIFGIFHLVENQRTFELQRWQAHLSEASQGASEAAGHWLSERQQVLIKASVNPTVQIYLSELALAGFDPSKIQSVDAKRGFVGSYIAALGQRAPFVGEERADAKGAGVALFSGNQTLIASSVGFEPRFKDFQPALAGARDTPVGATFQNVDGQAFAYLVAPVKATQMPMPVVGAGHPIGYVVAVFPLGKAFLVQLAERSGFSSGVTLLDNTSNGVQALDVGADTVTWRPLSTDQANGRNLMAASKMPGHLFDSIDIDEASPLVMANSVANTTWTVVAYVDRSIALGGVTERLRSLLVTLLFGLLAVIAAVFALWRHGVSINALRAAHMAEAYAVEIAQRERVLQMVADTYPGELALVDRDDRVAFANVRFAGGAGADATALVGSPLVQTLPKVFGDEAQQVIDRSRREMTLAHTSDAIEVDGRFLTFSATPLRGTGWQEGGALLSINDVTDAVLAREKKAQLYWGLVDLLLDTIDQRDPGAAAHSRRVSKLSAGLMRQSDGSKEDVETAEIAGALLNVGKLFVPSELLTKSGKLDSDERDTFLSGGQKWLDLLLKVPFDLPIVAVLSDAQSLMQGRITPEQARAVARVIVVANGYVALVSPRTYRELYSHEDAIAALSENRTMDVEIVKKMNHARLV